MKSMFEKARLDRRQFLRVMVLSASAVVAPFLSASLPGSASRVDGRNQFYRGTIDGKLLRSDNGYEWEVLTDFGPQLAVREARTGRDGWVYVTLITGGLPFVLKSRDEKTWYTQDYDPFNLA